MNTRVSYGLDSLIPKDNCAKNLPSYNLAHVLANLFGDLSLTSINFRFSPTFLVFLFYPAAFDDTNGPKPLDFTFFGGPATCNPGNILVFYH